MITDNNRLDDFDPNEWGNTDSDILNPKWNYKNAAKERMSSESTRKKLSESIKKKQSDPKYKEYMSRQRLEAMDKPIDASGITLREKVTETNRKSAANPIHHANRTAANRRMRKDPTWIEAQKKGCWDAYGYTVTTPMGEFPCMYEFDRSYNLPKSTCARQLKGLPHLFYKTEDGPGETVYERIFYTPYGIFHSVPEAYAFAREQGDAEANKLKQMDNWFMKMCVFHPDKFYMKFEIARYWPNESIKPIGETDKKPRFTLDKMLALQSKWQTRLSNQTNIYKKLKNNK